MAQLETWYEQVLRQMAAESYLEGVNLSNRDEVKEALLLGNNRIGFNAVGLTRLTPSQADEFLSAFTIRHQLSDNATGQRTTPAYLPGTRIPANSGVSATLIQSKANPNEYTLSIRSTESQPWSLGGDRERDGLGADASIAFNGFAFAQLDALDRYFNWLKSPAGGNLLPAGAVLTVTGYSLGGALAAGLTLLYPREVAKSYTFNGAGVGYWDATKGSLADVLSRYRAVLGNPDAAGWVPDALDSRAILYGQAKAGAGSDARSIYGDARYQWAVEAVKREFGTGYDVIPDPLRLLGDGLRTKVTQIYGRATRNDAELVANSGRHGYAVPVFIEGQPRIEPEDYGNTHSIVLLADSLALMRVYEKADPTLTQAQIQAIFAASTSELNSLIGSTVEARSLEHSLDALRKLVGVPSFATSPVTEAVAAPRGFGDFDARERFHERIDELSGWLAGRSYSIRPLVDIVYGYDASGRALTTQPSRFVDVGVAATRSGDEGRAYRYALRELNPFAVMGADYSRGSVLNPSGELERFDPVAAPDGMTDSYMADRAAILRRFLDINVENESADGSAYPEIAHDFLKWAKDPLYYEDRSNGFRLSQMDQFERASRVIFGGESGDEIAGGLRADRLYGDAGNDLLRGGGGDDYLEGGRGDDGLVGGPGSDRLVGGSGTDLYVWNAGDGTDVISDSDGVGRIIYQGRTLTGGALQSPGVFVDSEGSRYVLIENSSSRRLLIDGTLSVENFSDGVLGIHLATGEGPHDPSPPSSAASRVYVNGAIPVNGASSDEDWPIRDYAGSDRDDLIHDDEGLTAYYGRRGDDVIVLAVTGPDRSFVDTGAGSDLIDASQSEAPLPRLAGGGGNDYILGGSGDDVIWGDNYGVASLAGGREGSYVLDSFNFVSEYEDPFVTPYLVAIRSGQENLPVSDIVLAENWLFPEGLAQATAYIVGGEGTTFDDYVEAGSGDDIVQGGSGDDLVIGGDGDDVLAGDYQDEAPFGTHRFSPALYKDQLGDEVGALFGRPGHDILDGGDGNDVLVDTYLGSDVFFGGAGDDSITSNDLWWQPTDSVSASDYIDAGDGNDTITVINPRHGASDLIDAGGGDDLIEVDRGNPVIFAGPGDDVIFVLATADSVEESEDESGAGEQPIDPYVVDAFVDAGPGNDTISVAAVFASLDGGEGDDLYDFQPDVSGYPVQRAIVRDAGGNDTFRVRFAFELLGPDVTDSSFGRYGFEPAENWSGRPTFWDRAEQQGDALIFSSLAVDLQGATTFDQELVFENWYSSTSAQIETFQVDSISGSVAMTASEFSNWGLFHFGDATSGVLGTETTDRLIGSAGTDAFYGGEGTDLLAGGPGADLLDGGQGDDSYFWSIGHGDDLIFDEAGFDQLWLAPGIEAASLSIIQGPDSIRLSVADASIDIFVGASAGQGDLPIDRVNFADGGFLALSEHVDTNAFVFPGDRLDANARVLAGDWLPDQLPPESALGGNGNENQETAGAVEGGQPEVMPGIARQGQGADREVLVALDVRASEDRVIEDEGFRPIARSSLARPSDPVLADADEAEIPSAIDASNEPDRAISLGEIEAAIEAFELSAAPPRRETGSSASSLARTDVVVEAVSSWAMTNALLSWHLDHTDEETLGSDLSHLAAARTIPAAAVTAALGQSVGRNILQGMTTLQSFRGLQEGFAQLA